MDINPHLIQSMERIINSEIVRKSLKSYFKSRELNGFIYPPDLKTLPEEVPMLHRKVEVVPHIEEIDPISGLVTIAWNMFVLGNNRLFLGYSKHESMQHMENSVDCGEQSGGRATPESITDYILSVIDNKNINKDGSGPDSPSLINSYYPNNSSKFYQKNRLNVGSRL